MVLISLIYIESNAQYVFEKYPLDYCMVPRDLSTNKGVVHFNFSIDAQLNPDSIVMEKYEDDLFISSIKIKYTPSGSTYQFKYSDTIEAALHDYSYELWYGSASLIKKAVHICSGDFYILSGQSNAVSFMVSESSAADYHPFIRTYGHAAETGYSKEWSIATGDGPQITPGHIGQLGIAIANGIVMKNKIPVCILNGAAGGMKINYFLRDENNRENQSTNYGRLYTRVKEAGALEDIRAIIWYQGENDAYSGTPYDVYFDFNKKLFDSWKEDFHSTENIYLFQVKTGCKQDLAATGAIQQAQSDMGKIDQNIKIISTSDIPHAADQCHLDYFNGYKKLGAKTSRLINYYQYDATDSSGIFSPQIYSASYKDSVHIALSVRQSDQLQLYSGILKDFYLNSYLQNPSDISIVNDTILLLFSTPLTANEQISYSDINSTVHAELPDSQRNGLLCMFKMNIELPIYGNSYFSLPEDTTSLIVFFSNEHLYINSKSRKVLHGNYKLFDIGGNLLKEENLKVFKGTDKIKILLNAGHLYLLTVSIETSKGSTVRKLKIQK